MAIALPATLTAVLLGLDAGRSRDYAFLYLGIVAALGVTRGLAPSLVAATASFFLIDFFFVEPVHTLTIADEQDLVNLIILFSAAGLVGGLGSRRRQTQLRAEALAGELRRVNTELARLNREQAEAAAVAVRLARSEQQVRLLEESDRLRREFLATVSHELRTPLSGILTLSTAAAARTDLPADARADQTSIAEQARRLGRLVSDMLDMARIEGKALDLHLETVDLGDAVEAAADRLRHTTGTREVVADIDSEHSVVVADWDRLGQILDNLLANADRFAPAGSPITVRVRGGLRDMVVLRVMDEGPGIPEQLRDHVFERFVRGPSEGGASTGLGLAIVRGLVEAQAGRVWIDDAGDGAGTTVAVALPAATEA